MTESVLSSIRPFLKWPGNKFALLSKINPLLPNGERLVEPFVGSGAVFLNTSYRNYLLNDINPDLISLYKIVQKETAEFIYAARSFFQENFNQAEYYYQLRKEFNETNNQFKKALLFLYLNKHGYNGLCRYNQKGKFNVPFGSYKKPYFPEKEIWLFAEKAEKARFHCLSFERFLKKVQTGDTVYCDPPYVPLSTTAHFTSYAPKDFGLSQQKKLATWAEKLSIQGTPVIISNHDTLFTRNIYQKAQLHFFSVRRFISCLVNQRKPVQELIAIYTPQSKKSE